MIILILFYVKHFELALCMKCVIASVGHVTLKK